MRGGKDKDALTPGGGIVAKIDTDRRGRQKEKKGSVPIKKGPKSDRGKKTGEKVDVRPESKTRVEAVRKGGQQGKEQGKKVSLQSKAAPQSKQRDCPENTLECSN